MTVKSVRINTNAKAILGTGKAISRAQVLTSLGLNPGTPPEAWLAIIACGSNASALRSVQAGKLLDTGKISASNLHRSVRARITGG